MNTKKTLVTLGFTCVAATLHAQCTAANQLKVTVVDTAAAPVPASVRLNGSEVKQTDAAGVLILPCVVPGPYALSVNAPGFQEAVVRQIRSTQESEAITVVLAIASVQTSVDVVGQETSAESALEKATTLNAEQLKGMANDPDEFRRQLLALTASQGSQSNVVISVDGFQESSTIPPKDSIISVRTTPNPYTAELQYPVVDGGRLEITTKPGTAALHGSIFFNSSSSSFNASDPYSLSSAPAGNQNVGIDLTGPILHTKSGYGLSLERRSIREQSIVNAVGLSAALQPTSLLATVAAPQTLWLGDFRSGLQVNSTDYAVVSLTANVNDSENQGVGGLTLPEAGYDLHTSEYDLRLSNNQPIGAFLLHQSRVGFTWKTIGQAPASSSPSLTVAGFFSDGGSPQGDLHERDNVLEVDEGVDREKRGFEIRLGTEVNSRFYNDRVPNLFNGSYVFGGGSAPVLSTAGGSGSTTITGLEQYRRALAGLPGGTPTTFQLTTGSPRAQFTQYRQAFYTQLNLQLPYHTRLQLGMRYQLQTAPQSFSSYAPRAGVSWAPVTPYAMLNNWVIHLEAGIFSSPVNPTYVRNVKLLDGVANQQVTVYSPQFGNPLQPIAGSISVNAFRSFANSIHPDTFLQAEGTLERSFGKHWSAAADFTLGQNWRRERIRNINAPLVGSAVGPANPNTALMAPRPMAPNLDIFQYESTGHLVASLPSFHIAVSDYKGFSLMAQYNGMTGRGDEDNSAPAPQSSYSKQGESARPDFVTKNSLVITGDMKLPFGLQSAAQFDYNTGSPYNIVTGTDANGDGIFNDRPSYTTTLGPASYQTRYGLLTTATTNGTIPRNLGTMPSLSHLNASLRRDISLDHRKNHDLRVLTLSVRSANLLNHTNVVAVGTVLGSTNFDHGVNAEPARRVELGARLSF